MTLESKAIQRCYNFFLGGSEFFSDPKAAYKCGSRSKADELQRAWVSEYFMKEKLSIFITIKLPEYRSRRKTIKSYYKSKDQYKEIIRELEEKFTDSRNHWDVLPFPFTVSYQKTKSKTWVVYLLIKTDTINMGFVFKLCLAIEQVLFNNKYDEDVIDIRPITNQEGLSKFAVKTQKNEDLTHDEGNTILTLENWFNVKEKPEKFLAYIKELDDKFSKCVENSLEKLSLLENSISIKNQ